MMILKETYHFIEIEISLDDGTQIGTAEIEPNERQLERFEIWQPYQDKGFGQKALDMLIKKYGIESLWVRSSNDRAVHIYQKRGFKKINETMYEMWRANDDHPEK